MATDMKFFPAGLNSKKWGKKRFNVKSQTKLAPKGLNGANELLEKVSSIDKTKKQKLIWNYIILPSICYILLCFFISFVLIIKTSDSIIKSFKNPFSFFKFNKYKQGVIKYYFLRIKEDGVIEAFKIFRKNLQTKTNKIKKQISDYILLFVNRIDLYLYGLCLLVLIFSFYFNYPYPIVKMALLLVLAVIILLSFGKLCFEKINNEILDNHRKYTLLLVVAYEITMLIIYWNFISQLFITHEWLKGVATVLFGAGPAYLIWHWRDENKRKDQENIALEIAINEDDLHWKQFMDYKKIILDPNQPEPMKISAVHELGQFYKLNVKGKSNFPALVHQLFKTVLDEYWGEIDIKKYFSSKKRINKLHKIAKTKFDSRNQSKTSNNETRAHVKAIYHVLEQASHYRLNGKKLFHSDNLSFTGFKFINTEFSNFDLDNTDLSYSLIFNTTFKFNYKGSIILNDINLDHAHIINSGFESSNIPKIINAQLYYTNITHSKLEGLELNDCQIHYLLFRHGTFKYIYIESKKDRHLPMFSIIKDSVLSTVRLTNIEFFRCIFNNVKCTGSSFTNFSFFEGLYRNFSFCRVEFKDAEIIGLRFKGSSFFDTRCTFNNTYYSSKNYTTNFLYGKTYIDKRHIPLDYFNERQLRKSKILNFRTSSNGIKSKYLRIYEDTIFPSDFNPEERGMINFYHHLTDYLKEPYKSKVLNAINQEKQDKTKAEDETG